MPAFNAMSEPHTTIIGVYAGPTGMICLKHRGRRIGQPMTVADVKYEGYPAPQKQEDGHPWCPTCARMYGRQNGHEYVVQKAKNGWGYEVIDITVEQGSLVVKRSFSYEECKRWIEGEGK